MLSVYVWREIIVWILDRIGPNVFCLFMTCGFGSECLTDGPLYCLRFGFYEVLPPCLGQWAKCFSQLKRLEGFELHWDFGPVGRSLWKYFVNTCLSQFWHIDFGKSVLIDYIDCCGSGFWGLIGCDVFEAFMSVSCVVFTRCVLGDAGHLRVLCVVFSYRCRWLAGSEF